MTFPVKFELSSLNGENGFVVEGVDSSDRSGFAVSSAGDVNGDGFDDFLIGAPFAENGFGQSYSGKAFLLYGNSSLGSNGRFSLSNIYSENGLVILPNSNNFRYSGYQLGDELSSAGDINGDGFDDIIIGVPGAPRDPYDSSYLAGESYVIFGDPTIDTDNRLFVNELNGRNGFTLFGETSYDFSGSSVSKLGDFNGDGFDDLIIGTPGYDRFNPDSIDNPYDNNVGISYIVLGNSDIWFS